MPWRSSLLQVYGLKETPPTAMVGGYFLRVIIVTIRVASAINTSVYVNISPYVTIAAPPVKEVDNLAAPAGCGHHSTRFPFLSNSAALTGRLCHRRGQRRKQKGVPILLHVPAPAEGGNMQENFGLREHRIELKKAKKERHAKACLSFWWRLRDSNL